jgi:hypothetical protein
VTRLESLHSPLRVIPAQAAIEGAAVDFRFREGDT